MSEPSPTSNAVDRALSILELAAEHERGLTHAELARRLEIPKSTLSYLLSTLEKRGYLTKGDGGRFRLGLAVVKLGRGVGAHEDLPKIAGPVLRQLADRTRLTAHLARLEGRKAVYVDRYQGPGMLQIDSHVGQALPPHATAVGKALLAFRPEDEVRRLLGDGPLERVTERAVTSVDALLDELELVRRAGWALDDEEYDVGVRCVAAPVLGADGRAAAAIGLTGSVRHLPRDRAEETARAAIKSALLISRRLGHEPESGGTPNDQTP